VQLKTTLQYFMPFVEHGSVVAEPVPFQLLALVGALVASLAVVGAFRRRVPGWSVVVFYACAFLLYRILFLPVHYYEWYEPPFAVLVALIAGAGLETLPRRYGRPALAITGVLMVAFALPQLWLVPIEARVQHDIEDQVRTRVGQYLAGVVHPGQSVVSESAGYVGYYSNAMLYDYPGLTSAVSAAALAKAPPGQRSLSYLVDTLQPDWIVLRPGEIDDLAATFPQTFARYRLAKRFKVSVDLEFAGVIAENHDQDFSVFERSADCAGARSCQPGQPWQG